jgi:hypothetical protein
MNLIGDALVRHGPAVDLDVDCGRFPQRVVHRAVGDDRVQWVQHSCRQACGHGHPQLDRGNASWRSVCLAVLGMDGQTCAAQAVTLEVSPCLIGHTGR